MAQETSDRILHIIDFLQLVFLLPLYFLLPVPPGSLLSLSGLFFCMILSSYHLSSSSRFQPSPNHNAPLLSTALPPICLHLRLML